MNSLRAVGGSITLKLIMLLILVSLLPLIAVSYYGLKEGTSSLEEQEQVNLRQLAISTAGRLDQLIGDTERSVRVLAGDREVAEFLSGKGDARKRFRATVDRELFNIRDSVKDFAQVYLMDREGVFVASTNPKVINKNYAFREYFHQAAKGRFFRSELIFGSTSGVAGIYFSGPVRADDGAVVGVAVLKLKGEALFHLIDSMSSASGRRAFLVDGNHIVTHHPDRHWRYRSLIPLPDERGKQILARMRYPVEKMDSLGLNGLYQLLTDRESGYLRLSKTVSGQNLVAGYAPMVSKPWSLVVTEPEEVFSEPLNRLFIQSMSGVAVVAVLGILLAVVAGRLAGRPITHLIRAAAFMERGEYVGREEPFSPRMLQLQGINHKKDELGRLARVFEEMAGQVYQRHEELEAKVRERTQQLEDKNEQLERAQRRILRELKVARSLQQSILPTKFPDHGDYDLFATMRPAREVGGDFYDFFLLDDHRLGLVIADVSGKGVPAAFFMAVSRTLIQNLAADGRSPAEVISLANDLLCRENPLELFVTVLYGVFDIRSGEFSYVNGGHNPPLAVRSEGKVEALPMTGGMALGVMEGLDYGESSITLGAGDVLVLFTDGVTEAFNTAQQAFGDDQLVELVQGCWNRSSSDVIEAIAGSVSIFTAGAEPSDDLTCLALRYTRTVS